MNPHLLLAFGIGTLALTASACNFGRLAEDLEEIERLGEFRVQLTGEGTESPGVVVLLEEGNLRAANLGILHGSRATSLRCLPGAYYIAAFRDLDEDLEHDEGEPAAFYGDRDLVTIGPGQSLSIEIRVETGQATHREIEFGRRIREANEGFPPPGAVRVAPLTDPIFARENGTLGMWEPWEFLRRELAGLYLLEPYDPDRIPVLYVHGIGGTPLDFEALIADLDREVFQPVVFFYPSALRLEDLGTFLDRSLSVWEKSHQTHALAIVSHSMGGLVARSAIDQYLTQGEFDYLGSFVSIASPLGGMPSAKLGVSYAPTVMPCWYDLAPGSPFLEGLFEPELPQELPHLLLFGYGEGGGDGVVPIERQLWPVAQLQSERVLGVDATHVGILSDAMTLEAVRAALHEHARRAGTVASKARTGGARSITGEDLAAHVTQLASDEFEGRGAGTEGGRKAATYIAEAFESFGLQPIDDTLDFFQTFEARGAKTQNVVGLLEGSHPERKHEFIVIGAHYDHLGKDAKTGAIYHGADDDASGTSVMLEVAEAFARHGKRPERSLLFIAFGAEELGLLGSRHYVEHPLRPLEQTKWMVNLEMMGRGDEGQVTVMLLSELPAAVIETIEEHGSEHGLDPVDGGDAHIRSGDQFPFHDAGVPILCFYGGDNHPDYHQPSDTADKIQPEWMQSVARVVYGSVHDCANGEPQPHGD